MGYGLDKKETFADSSYERKKVFRLCIRKTNMRLQTERTFLKRFCFPQKFIYYVTNIIRLISMKLSSAIWAIFLRIVYTLCNHFKSDIWESITMTIRSRRGMRCWWRNEWLLRMKYHYNAFFTDHKRNTYLNLMIR